MERGSDRIREAGTPADRGVVREPLYVHVGHRLCRYSNEDRMRRRTSLIAILPGVTRHAEWNSRSVREAGYFDIIYRVAAGLAMAQFDEGDWTPPWCVGAVGRTRFCGPCH